MGIKSHDRCEMDTVSVCRGFKVNTFWFSEKTW